MLRAVLLSVIVAVLLPPGAAGQIFIEEDFSSASGFTPPAGWSLVVLAGPTSVARWRFDDPNGNGATAPITTPFATCDSDFVGPTLIISHLSSVAFDASSVATMLTLEWDQWHLALASTATVSVFDGISWNVVYTDSAGTTMNDTQTVDITAAAGGAPNARVRFEYVANFGFHWQVDNVRIKEPAAVDVGIASIDGPTGGAVSCIPLGVAESVMITIENPGLTALPAGTSIPVAYSLDGQPEIQETAVLGAPLPPGGTLSFTFAATEDFSFARTYRLDARSLFPDAVPQNDVVSGFEVLSGSGSTTAHTYPFTESFDGLDTDGTTTPPAGWIQETTDGFGTTSDWFFRNSPTPSIGTGPPADHTTGVVGAGFYAYVEDSGSGNHAAVTLLTPCLDLSALVAPRLIYWIYSHDANAGLNENFMAIDVIAYPGGLTLDVVPPVGHLPGQAWTLQLVDLSAFAGQSVRVRFRGRSDGGSHTHDQAIDDVTVLDGTPGQGQAPQAGLGVLDINMATTAGGTLVSSGSNGPYFVGAEVGKTFAFRFEGEPMQPVLLLAGALNPGAATYGAIGQMDIGGAIDPSSGFPIGLTIVANGLAAGGLNPFLNTGPAGTSIISFVLPLVPPGILSTFQTATLASTAPYAALSNAVQVTIL